NLKTLEQAREEEAKLRRAGLVADEDWQARWYLDRIPAEIHSATGLDAWYRKLEQETKQALRWSLADLLPGEGQQGDLYPKYFALGDARLPLHYKFEPGAADDGVTLEVPLPLLNALDPARLSWLAPGFVADKAAGLIRTLPKAMRRNYVPAPDFGRAFAEAFAQATADSIAGELARFLSRTTGSPVAALDFDEAALEPHLSMNLRLRELPGRATWTTCARASASVQRAPSPPAPPTPWPPAPASCASSPRSRCRCRSPATPACPASRRWWTKARTRCCGCSPTAARPRPRTR